MYSFINGIFFIIARLIVNFVLEFKNYRSLCMNLLL